MHSFSHFVIELLNSFITVVVSCYLWLFWNSLSFKNHSISWDRAIESVIGSQSSDDVIHKLWYGLRWLVSNHSVISSAQWDQIVIWNKRVPSDTSIRHTVLKEEIQKIYKDSRQNYGASKITAELRKSRERISEKTVGNYIRQMDLKAQWVSIDSSTRIHQAI